MYIYIGKFIFKNLKSIFKLKKVENTIYSLSLYHPHFKLRLFDFKVAEIKGSEN